MLRCREVERAFSTIVKGKIFFFFKSEILKIMKMDSIFIYAGLKLTDINYIVHSDKPVQNRQVYFFDKEKNYRGGMFTPYCDYIKVQELLLLSLKYKMYNIVPPDEGIKVELELEEAIDIDLFDCYGNLLVNRQYYTRSGDTVQGPFMIEYNRNHQKFKEAMSNGIIYVAKKQQKEFENLKL
jgi:hypothetical protein